MSARSVVSDRGGSRVVLVGTARYTDEDLPDLPAVANNLKALRTALTRGPSGLSPECCTVLLDPEDPHEVLEALADAAADADDTLVFYYAGHGLPDAIGADDQLLLALTRSDERRPWRSLSYAAVRRVLLDPAATTRRKVVILDCCFAGLAGGLGEPDGLGNSADVAGSYVLTATSPTSRAVSPPGETYTGFTGALLNVLRDGIPGKGPVLDMNTIYERLVRVLPARGLPRPQQNNRDLGGKIAFVVNPAHEASGESRPAPTRPPRRTPATAYERPGWDDEVVDGAGGGSATASGLVIPATAYERPGWDDEDVGAAAGGEGATASGLVIPDTAYERYHDE